MISVSSYAKKYTVMMRHKHQTILNKFFTIHDDDDEL